VQLHDWVLGWAGDRTVVHIDRMTKENWTFYTEQKCWQDEGNRLSKAAAVATQWLPVVCKQTLPIKPAIIHWLWQDRIPFGKLTLFTGHPGVGKGLATLDIAARASTGEDWVDCRNTNPPVEVLILSDRHATNSILARLMAAGADLSKILIMETNDTNTDPLALKNCLEANPDVKLVIIDPVFKDDFKPLAGIAEKYGVAVILVAHIKKNSGIPYVCDVIGMVGAVRVAWSFGEDKLDGKMKMIPLKAQGSRDMQLSYSIVGQDVEINGEFCSIGKIQWY
jgi:hypothetical protein